MSIKFENTSYLRAIKENENLFYEQKIAKNAQAKLQFKYGHVTLQKFNQKYSAEGWCGRKIIALPAAAWSGAVKTAYHLAKAILFGILTAPCNKGKYFQSQCFYFARDLQESFGWLISFFNDRFGQYHVQESEFHKTCYDCFSADSLDLNALHNPPSNTNPKFAAQPQNIKTSHSPDSEFDKEIKEIKKLWDFDLREKRFCELAEAYLKKDNQDKALKTIKEIFLDTKTKEIYIVKIADAFLKKGDRENALKTIEEIYSDTKSKEIFIIKAELGFDEDHLGDDLDQTLKTIKKRFISRGTKEWYIDKIANAFLNKGDREKALNTIEEIYYDTQTKEAFIAKVAESYYNDGDLDKVLKTIKELRSDTKTKESFILKIAHAFSYKGDQKKALNTIKEIHDTKTKETFLIKVELGYDEDHLGDDLNKTLKTIKDLHISTSTKEGFIAKIADAFLNKGDREKALNTIKEISWDTKTKETFIAKVAESYYDKGDLEKALKTIKDAHLRITHGSLILKIANAFLIKGNREKALKTIKEIYSSDAKAAFLIQIAQSYFSANDEIGVVKIIKELVEGLLQDKMIKMGLHEIYMQNTIFSNAGDEFFFQIAKACYELTKGYFSSHNAQAILEAIITRATDISTIDAFIALQPEKTRAGFESSENKTSPNKDKLTSEEKDKYCKVLGLTSEALWEDIRKAYKKLSLKYHADKILQKEDESDSEYQKRKELSAKKFNEIAEAHEKLAKDEQFYAEVIY